MILYKCLTPISILGSWKHGKQTIMISLDVQIYTGIIVDRPPHVMTN